MRMFERLSNFHRKVQQDLFPELEEQFPQMLKSHQRLIAALELIKIEQFLPRNTCWKGRPPKSRAFIAKAFVSKAIFNLPTTLQLRERLLCDKILRTLCGWENVHHIPSESTFSRAFETFSNSRLPEVVHTALIKEAYKGDLVGHLSRDSTDISMREKSKKKREKYIKKTGGPRSKGPGKCEKQLTQTLEEMLNTISMECDFGSKVSSKGHRLNWIGYKFHVDVADGGIPITCMLTSASAADTTMAIPLSIVSNQKVTALYELMDKGYYAKAVKQFIESEGRRAHIATCAKNAKAKEEQADELKAQATLKWQPTEVIRQKHRTVVERFFSNLKDNFGGRSIRVKGNKKVFCHLMFGVVALATIQLLRMNC